MTDARQASPVWWGDSELQTGSTGRWRIGPLELFVRRDATEWMIARTVVGGARDATVEIETPCAAGIPDGTPVSRYAMRETGSHLRLRPRLADRAVVVKPASPVSVPRGEAVTFYVGSPLWVEIGDGEHDTTLLDVPALQPSDTWAGPNTREGLLCYGSRTHARRRLEDCTVRPHRAITRVDIENGGDGTLLIEQLQLPAPMLAVYVDADGVLFTESVALTRKRSDTEAELVIGTAEEVGGASLQRLSGPREVVESNFVFQAFHHLFGREG